jgi:hypothetical protein
MVTARTDLWELWDNPATVLKSNSEIGVTSHHCALRLFLRDLELSNKLIASTMRAFMMKRNAMTNDDMNNAVRDEHTTMRSRG